MSHLFRPPRRRLRRGRRLPERPNAPTAGRAARQRRRHADVPGDPLTPGVGATKDAKRLAVADAPTITKIPVLPISYGDAQPLLAALGGPTVPASWRGGLPISYRFGPGAARVHLKVKSDWSLKTLYDVIAKLPGSTEADQWVIRGNHHDAWVNGAEDPISGLGENLEPVCAGVNLERFVECMIISWLGWGDGMDFAITQCPRHTTRNLWMRCGSGHPDAYYEIILHGKVLLRGRNPSCDEEAGGHDGGGQPQMDSLENLSECNHDQVP